MRKQRLHRLNLSLSDDKNYQGRKARRDRLLIRDDDQTRSEVLACENRAKYVCWVSDYGECNAQAVAHYLAPNFFCGEFFLRDFPNPSIFICERCKKHFRIHLEKLVFPESRRRADRNRRI